jgi:hypothetical protein
MPTVKPVTPKEAVDRAREDIPNEVVEAFNELIAKDIDTLSGEATVMQDEVLELIRRKLKFKNDEKIFGNKWLDVEPLFRKAGWTVVYDKPGYNESGRAYYTFKKKGKH